MAPHHWFVQPVVGSYISFGVGYCFIWYKAMREASSKDKAISSHTFFFIRFPLGIGSHNLNLMGKVTQEAIRTAIIQELRNDWRKLEWRGINIDIVDGIERVEPTLAADFKYEGSGEYEFSAQISFWVKYPENADELHNKSYRIFPCCKVSIKETEDCFKTKIILPIHLQKLY